MAGTSEELSGQSEQLAEMISFFTVNSAHAVGYSGSSSSSHQGIGDQAQSRLSHVSERVFRESQKAAGDVFEASGKSDNLDNEFESF